MTPISVVIITYNEAHVLSRTLQSVSWADEVIVVDSGSTDATIQLAETTGAKVYSKPFEGYGVQKCYAVGLASYDWILSLDADEVVSPELADEIKMLLKNNPDCVGYKFPISLVYHGRLLRFSGEYNKRFLRLFNRREGNFTTDTIHEKVQLQGKIGKLKNRVYHYSFDNLADHLNKINAYTSLAAQSLQQNYRHATKAKAILRFPLTFLRIYILKLGFLDGYEGFLWAFYMSVYTLTKYTKLVESQRQSLIV
jgi:glycosyltransferase involved in cell wall biosynthesis